MRLGLGLLNDRVVWVHAQHSARLFYTCQGFSNSGIAAQQKVIADLLWRWTNASFPHELMDTLPGLAELVGELLDGEHGIPYKDVKD